MSFLITLSLCVASLCDGGDRPGGEPIELRMKATATARGLDVKVGELCDVSPPTRDALAVADITFGPAPVLGYARTISRAELLQALVAAGHDAGAFKIEGAQEITVQSIVTEVPVAEIVDAATAALQAVLAAEGGDVEFELATRVRQVQAQPGRRSQELKARLRNHATGPVSAVVDVEVLVDGQRCKLVPVQFKLVRFQQVLRTEGTIRAGTPLGPDNLTVAREPLAQATGLFLSSLEQVQGLIARRNLQGNARLTLGDVGPPALIRRGEIVTVVSTRGRVKVTAKAIANHDAALGETVSLTNQESRAQVTGTAAAPGTVVIQGSR
jgi:flagella basal body P-ring formation protein FlgA